MNMRKSVEVSAKNPASHLDTSNPKRLRRQRIHTNAKRLDEMGVGVRGDAHSGVDDTVHLARDLEHIYDEVVQQQFAPTGAFDMFPIDQRVQPGAKTHTVRRSEYAGEPKIHRSTDEAQPDRGRVNIRRDEETFQVLYYTLDIPIDFFDEMHADYAQLNLREELMDAAQVIMERFATENALNGLDAYNFYGIFNYPWLNKQVVTQALVDSPSNAEADAIKAQILQGESEVIERSQTRATPDRVVTSPRVDNYLQENELTDNENESIKQVLLRRFRQIDEIEVDPDFEDIGPNGEDGMFFFTDTRRAIAHSVPEPFTMLPITQTDSFEWVIPTYMAHGGIVMRDPWANLLQLIDVQS
jgi:hypothetical protein